MLRPTHTKLYATPDALEIVDVEAHRYQTIRYSLYLEIVDVEAHTYQTIRYALYPRNS